MTAHLKSRVIDCRAEQALGRVSMQLSIHELKDMTPLLQVDSCFMFSLLKKQGGTYLIAMDPHAMHERILLESYQMLYLSDTLISRMILVPAAVKKHLTLNLDCLKEHRLNYIPSRDTFVYPQVISMFSDNEIADLFEKCALEHILSTPMLSPGLWERLASKACRNAVMFGTKLSIATMEQLLKDIEQCKKPFKCAHGRPSIVVIHQFR
ncbi:hypothetical protein EDD86DRAFT_205793 [Gorgonomyces haynaldii]|nr:hypothetical protein EDD86DRAFT_205793 [Gorgonomyces haynaldii]